MATSRLALARALPLILILMLMLTPVWPPFARPAAAQPAPLAPYCLPGQTPALGARFTRLAALLGETIGEPLECEHVEVTTGDVHQRSTGGLLYYRARGGSPSFTDGFGHWALTGGNLAVWRGDAPDPSDSTVELPAEPAVTVVGPARAPPDLPPP